MTKHFLLFALGLMMMTLGVQQIQADGSFPENTIWSEDFESGVLPEEWIATSANWSIDGGDHRDETTAFSGIKNLLYFYNGSGGVDTLYTATIDLSGYRNVSLNFTFTNAQWNGDIDYLEVFYRNSPDESWTSLGGLIEAEHSDWTGFNFSLANVSSTFQLAFAVHSNYGYGVAIDDIYITGTAQTPDPAGDKLTVFEGEITNSSVPFYGFYGEEYLRAQYVIPADKLTKLKGKKINALRWYSSRTDIPDYGDARIDVYLKEVYSTTLSNFVAKEDEDIVYHGEVILSYTADGKLALTLVFEEDFVYFGGNLLVGCDNVEKGYWTSINWYGQNVTNASVYGHSTSDISAITATQRNFIPQTTFFYEDAPQGATIKPIPDPAGDKLTVFEGEITNSNVPFYGLYCEEYLRSQYLIPADALTALEGKKINALRWYSPRTDIPNYGDARIDVYVKEVDSTALRDFVEKADDDIVYHGNVVIYLTEDGKYALTLVLDKDFIYQGGNLLVGCDNVETGNWTTTYWYGQEVENASVYGRSSSDISAITATQSNFVPKTTFFYEGGSVDITVEEDGWAHYDNGSATGVISPADGEILCWGIRIPAGTVTNSFLTKVSIYVSSLAHGEATIRIYQGGPTPSQANLLHSQDVSLTANNAFQEITLEPTVMINTSQDVWIVFESANSVATYCDIDNAIDGRWIKDGLVWKDIKVASEGGIENIAWMIRGLFEFGPYASDAATTVTATSAKITWSGNAEAYDLLFYVWDADQEMFVRQRIETNVEALEYTLTGLSPETGYAVQVVPSGFVTPTGDVTIPTNHYSVSYFTTLSPCGELPVVEVSNIEANSAQISWTGSVESCNLRYAAIDPTVPATIIFGANDVWHDGSGYQMLIDADANTYDRLFNSSHAKFNGYETGDVPNEVYAEYEYKIPENACGNLAEPNVLLADTVTLEIPAGVYDWTVTNPSPSVNTLWIIGSYGNAPRSADDWAFEGGMTYEFITKSYDGYDGLDVTITPTFGWIVIEDITSPFALNDLDPNTMYVVQVQVICDDATGAWGEMRHFTTLEEGTGIESRVDSRESKVESRKILHEGHLFILRDGKIFNAQGARVK